MSTYSRIGEILNRPPELFDGMTWAEYLDFHRQTAPEGVPSRYARSVLYGELCLRCNQYSKEYGVGPNGEVCCMACRGEEIPKAGRGEFRVVEVTIPPAYAHATLEQLPAKNQKMLKAWGEKLPFVAIGGLSGSGKTHAAYAVVKHEASLGRRVRYEECLGLRKRWASAMPDRREWLMHGLADTRWLILDALTDSDATEGWLQACQWLLNERFKAQRPTLVTTMHNSRAIAELWGNAILSRLNQYHWTVLPAVDQREKHKVKAEDAA